MFKERAVKINSVIEFLNFIFSEDFNFYRGQENVNWSLIPSIARIKKPRSCDNIQFNSWLALEDYLIVEFKRQSIPFLDWQPENKFDWLVQAQHYGLPTRLIDWSTNALKALYFSVENPELDNEDGVVYGCYADHWSSTQNICESQVTKFFYSGHLNSRIIAQEGCFSLSPISDDGFEPFTPIDASSKNIQDLCKIIISKEEKMVIRHYLKKLGINHSTIYPGLDGISKSICSGFMS